MPIQFLWTLIWNHPLVVHYLAHSPLPQLHFIPTKPSRDSSSPCHMLPLNWCLLRKEWFIGAMLEGSTTCHQPMPQCFSLAIPQCTDPGSCLWPMLMPLAWCWGDHRGHTTTLLCGTAGCLHVTSATPLRRAGWQNWTLVTEIPSKSLLFSTLNSPNPLSISSDSQSRS